MAFSLPKVTSTYTTDVPEDTLMLYTYTKQPDTMDKIGLIPRTYYGTAMHNCPFICEHENLFMAMFDEGNYIYMFWQHAYDKVSNTKAKMRSVLKQFGMPKQEFTIDWATRENLYQFGIMTDKDTEMVNEIKTKQALADAKYRALDEWEKEMENKEELSESDLALLDSCTTIAIAGVNEASTSTRLLFCTPKEVVLRLKKPRKETFDQKQWVDALKGECDRRDIETLPPVIRLARNMMTNHHLPHCDTTLNPKNKKSEMLVRCLMVCDQLGMYPFQNHGQIVALDEDYVERVCAKLRKEFDEGPTKRKVDADVPIVMRDNHNFMVAMNFNCEICDKKIHRSIFGYMGDKKIPLGTARGDDQCIPIVDYDETTHTVSRKGEQVTFRHQECEDKRSQVFKCPVCKSTWDEVKEAAKASGTPYGIKVPDISMFGPIIPDLLYRRTYAASLEKLDQETLHRGRMRYLRGDLTEADKQDRKAQEKISKFFHGFKDAEERGTLPTRTIPHCDKCDRYMIGPDGCGPASSSWD